MQFRERHISGASRRSSDAAKMIDDHFDLMLLSSSWDARSIAITDTRATCHTSVLLLFDGVDKRGFRKKHDNDLTEFARERSGVVFPVSGRSIQVDQVFGQIEKHVHALTLKLKRPLKVLVDLSACPRYFSLSLFSLMTMHRWGASYSFFYPEGVYSKLDGDLEYAFTGGKWETVAIHGLAGRYVPGRKRFYLVSIGFEGAKTHRSVAAADPDRVAILVPNPGTNDSYPNETIEQNQCLLDDYVHDSDVLEAHAANAIEAWSAVTTWLKGDDWKENRYLLCCGSKPHSLGLAIKSIAEPGHALLYNIPEEHVVHETKPNGRFWRFDIRDTTIRPVSG